MLYIASAFTLGMLPIDRPGLLYTLRVETITVSDARYLVRSRMPIQSIIGHDDTAAMVSNQLGVDVYKNRASIQITQDDTILVAQYVGARLPEGAKTLPEGSRLVYLLVSLR